MTTFPVVINDRIVIPAGTYVQGRISSVKRGGHVKGRAEVLMHFSTLIYPSGYTVVLPGAVENVPGAEKTSMKDEEGTIRQDSQTGEKAKTVATAAGTGAVVGGLSNGVKGGLIGAGIGGGVGTVIGLLTRGNDVQNGSRHNAGNGDPARSPPGFHPHSENTVVRGGAAELRTRAIRDSDPSTFE